MQDQQNSRASGGSELPCWSSRPERSCWHTGRRASRRSQYTATSAAGARPASSTSSISAWRAPQRCQSSETGASRSNASPESRVRSAAASGGDRQTPGPRDRGRLSHAAGVPTTLHKVLTAVEAPRFVAPMRITLKASLLGGVTLGHRRARSNRRPSQATRCSARQHIIPRLGSLQLQNLSAAAIDMPISHKEGRVRSRGRPLGLLGTPRPRRSCTAPVRDASALGSTDGQPGRCRRSRPARRALGEVTCLEQRATGGLSSIRRQRSDLTCWRLLAMTGMRRGEALGLAWDMPPTWKKTA